MGEEEGGKESESERKRGRGREGERKRGRGREGEVWREREGERGERERRNKTEELGTLLSLIRFRSI